MRTVANSPVLLTPRLRDYETFEALSDNLSRFSHLSVRMLKFSQFSILRIEHQGENAIFYWTYKR